ncbi:MAG: RluA family pseudouridine synthase [Bacteriovoracaceae bacterium]|nr:RluA family pseudouridine synthase [Bacteriovoracaceae bacterium]
MEDELSEEIVLTVEANDLQFKRLDVYLTQKIKTLSRNSIKKLFEEDCIYSATTKLELKKMPPAKTEIIVEIPPPAPTEIQAQNIPLEFLYEDEFLAIINKPAGLVVHPAPGNYDKTLVNAILYHCPDLKGVGNEKRPGIVHRLDKGTSGVMVVAKEHKTHEKLVEIFSKHDINRQYMALVLGTKIDPKGILKSNIGRNPQNRLKMKANVRVGKDAITHYKVLEYFKAASLMEMTLETGRTHQIRVHLSQLLHRPIINDELYGNKTQEEKTLPPAALKIFKEYEHPFLHAKILGFKHPMTGKDLHFETPPPNMFQEVWKALK